MSADARMNGDRGRDIFADNDEKTNRWGRERASNWRRDVHDLLDAHCYIFSSL